MGIEQEIKQKKPFKNEKDRALVNLLYTHSRIVEKLNDHFREFNITRKQYNILRILKGASEPLTTSEIRARMIDKMSDITRLIERLINKGLVKKSIKKSDKRLVDVVISKKGAKLLDRIAKDKDPIHKYLDSLTQEEAKSLNLLLDKIRG